MRFAASAVILAGGQSRRMGRPKALLEVGGIRILDRLLNELIPSFDEVMVSAAPGAAEAFDVERLLNGRPETIVLQRDHAAFRGPAAALVAALQATRHPRVFVCSCDLPFLQRSIAQMLIEQLDDCNTVIPVVGGRLQPLCAAYRAGCAEVLGPLLAKYRRLVDLVEQVQVRKVEEDFLRQFDPELRSFIDVDTPEDYRRALLLD